MDDGLLDVHFERRTGRTGPGAGRPSKLYRRADCAVEVSFPERHYDLAGDLLAAAMAEAEESGERPGRRWPGWPRARSRSWRRRRRPARGATAALRVLEDHGFEPRAEGGEVMLANCPFHVLARAHTELVCGMNLRLLDGVLDGVPSRRPRSRGCEPSPGRCCVRLAPTRLTPALTAVTRTRSLLLTHHWF